MWTYLFNPSQNELLINDFLIHGIKYNKDGRVEKHYYTIDHLNNHITQVVQGKFKELYGENHLPVLAQRGNDTIAKLDTHNYIIFRDFPHKHIRQNIFEDYHNYSHKLSFKLAEFHAYIDIKDIAAGTDNYISIAPQERGALFGQTYLRNDKAYEDKYYKGEIFHRNVDLNPHFDQGSISVSFYLRNSEFKILEQHLYELHGQIQQGMEYNFFTQNCITFSHDIFNLFFEGSYMDYHITEELDFHDKGIYRSFIEAHSWSDIIKNGHAFADIALHEILGMDISQSTHALLLSSSNLPVFQYLKDTFKDSDLHYYAYNAEAHNIKLAMEDLNVQNIFKETPMHMALKQGNIEFAYDLLKLGADPNITDNKGNLPLHLAIQAQDTDNMKVDYVADLISKTDNIGVFEGTKLYTPILQAAKYGQSEIFNILVDEGADYNITNYLGNNAAHISAAHGQSEMMDLLTENIKYNHLLEQENKDNHTPWQVIEDLSSTDLVYPIHNITEFLYFH